MEWDTIYSIGKCYDCERRKLELTLTDFDSAQEKHRKNAGVCRQSSPMDTKFFVSYSLGYLHGIANSKNGHDVQLLQAVQLTDSLCLITLDQESATFETEQEKVAIYQIFHILKCH